MDAYWILILVSVARLTVASAVLYSLACWIFPLRSATWTTGPRAERRWARVLLISALVTLFVIVLALLDLYDRFTLLGGLLLILALALWDRHRRGEIVDTYVRLLELADRRRSVWLVLQSRVSQWGERLTPVPVLLVGLVLTGGALRLLPLLTSPASYSMTHYRLLETAQHLQAGRLFPGHMIEAHGLQGLSVALHTLGVVDLGIVIRLLGVAASLVLMGGVYVAVRGYSGDSVAALGAAGLFGFGVPVVPFAVENQVEPTPLLLAVAFALPTWYFLLRYQADGGGSRYGVGGAGVGLLLLTHGAVATLTLAALGGVGLVQRVRAASPTHARRAWHLMGLSLGGGVLLLGVAVLRHAVSVPDPYAVPVFSVGGAGVSFYPAALSIGAYGCIVGITALALLVTARVDPHPFRRAVSEALVVSCVILYAAWVFWEAVPVFDGPPIAPVALLSPFLCVAVGGLGARVRTALRTRFRRSASRALFRPLYYGSVPGLLVTGALLVPVSPLPVLKHPVEPDGYVRALHDLQRTGPRYQWTVVSHYGTGVRVMGHGRFLSYDYFLQHYDAETYDPTAAAAIPTEDLFLFVPSDTALSLVREEMTPFSGEIAPAMQRWCDTYRQRGKPLSVFYNDAHLTVYRITRSARTSTLVSPLLSRSAARSR